MEEILNYLKECGTFYVATIDGDQPRVRPFGAITEYEGRLYFVTNNKKEVFKQLLDNPKLEISGMNQNTWIRLEAKAVHEDNRGAREKMLAEYPPLTGLYSLDDGVMEVMYLKEAVATICSFGTEPKTITF